MSETIKEKDPEPKITVAGVTFGAADVVSAVVEIDGMKVQINENQEKPRLLRRFYDLPLGTRFRYLGSETVWVSLERHGCGKIAQWTDVNQWHVMQAICSVTESEDELRTIEVEPLDQSNDPS